MTVHRLKLCVGVDNVKGLAVWQAERLKSRDEGTQSRRALPSHLAGAAPARRTSARTAGWLYWVTKGYMLVRQRVLDLRPDRKDDGTACCGIVLDPELVLTRSHPRRAFQGWRYLDPSDAPRDLQAYDAAADEHRRARHARGSARA